MVALATEHGTSGLAAFGFGLYALASFLFDLSEGYRAGTIGMRLMEKYRAVELTAKMYGLFYAHVTVWYRSLSPLSPSLLSSHHTYGRPWRSSLPSNKR
jgi:predicted ATPase